MMSLHSVNAELVQDEIKLRVLQLQYDASVTDQGRIVREQFDTALRIKRHHINLREIINQEAVDWLRYQGATP